MSIKQRVSRSIHNGDKGQNHSPENDHLSLSKTLSLKIENLPSPLKMKNLPSPFFQ